MTVPKNNKYIFQSADICFALFKTNVSQLQVVQYNEVIKTISSLLIFYFFLRKDFTRTKTRHKQKLTNKTKIS